MEYMINPKTGEFREVSVSEIITSAGKVVLPDGWRFAADLYSDEWIEIVRLLTQRATDGAKSPVVECGCLAYEGTGKVCGYCNRPPRR